jgi:MFS transporter, PAT family, beta-lactamase induction signal transducer AmpG
VVVPGVQPDVQPAGPRAVPAWLWAVATLPFGVASGFAPFALPFFLRNAGVGIERISAISAISLAPAAYQFLWAPIVDLGPRRKHWVVLLSALGAACLAGALLMPLPTSGTARDMPFVILCVAGQALTGLTGSCTGGLMATTLPDAQRGRAGGWSNAGNLGGAALGAGVLMSAAGSMPRGMLAALTGAMIFLPSLSVLAIDEAPRPLQRWRTLFGGMLRSVWSTLRSRAGLSGVLICASPVATAAAMNLFSGVGPDYHASERVVTIVTGFAGGLITAVGAILGGYLCDRMPRRVAYLLSGGVLGACALAMSFYPLTERTYILGVGTYLFVAGFCYASFTSLALEIVGQAGATASTQYTLFTAAANQAIAYTTRFLGFGAARWGGAPGMLRADALANAVGIVFLSIVMLAMRARGRRARS